MTDNKEDNTNNKKDKFEGLRQTVEESEKIEEKQKKQRTININGMELKIRDENNKIRRTYILTEKHIDLLEIMQFISSFKDGNKKDIQNLIRESIEHLWEDKYKNKIKNDIENE